MCFDPKFPLKFKMHFFFRSETLWVYKGLKKFQTNMANFWSYPSINRFYFNWIFTVPYIFGFDPTLQLKDDEAKEGHP